MPVVTKAIVIIAGLALSDLIVITWDLRDEIEDSSYQKIWHDFWVRLLHTSVTVSFCAYFFTH